MLFKKQKLIDEISNNLAFLSKTIALNNVIGLFNNNRLAQDFYAEFFRLIFGYDDLKDLDKLNDVVNYPAIDLCDESAKIAFQITTQKDSKKIKDTISKFIKHELYKKYDRLIIFIIGEKLNYTTGFDTQNLFSFDKKKDIWDDNFLIKEITKLDINKIEEIRDFLKENLEEFKFPETLSQNDIKEAIQILKRDFGSIEKGESIRNARRDDDNFIKDIKNPANKLSWEFFKEEIKGHLKYNEDIHNFLRDPINKTSKKDYFEVSQKIQEYYNNPENSNDSFENIFKVVYDKVNLLYSDDIKNKAKILILLHNMYFNCDIGNNSVNND